MCEKSALPLSTAAAVLERGFLKTYIHPPPKGEMKKGVK